MKLWSFDVRSEEPSQATLDRAVMSGLGRKMIEQTRWLPVLAERAPSEGG